MKLSKVAALREMANWNDVSDMGLGKMIKDTRAFGRGVAQVRVWGYVGSERVSERVSE